MADDRNGVYSSDKEINFKTSWLKSNLCDHNDAQIFVKGTISVANADVNNTYIKVN